MKLVAHKRSRRERRKEQKSKKVIIGLQTQNTKRKGERCNHQTHNNIRSDVVWQEKPNKRRTRKKNIKCESSMQNPLPERRREHAWNRIRKKTKSVGMCHTHKTQQLDL